jgi:8-oxo-dGTP pyrophosphatase MutT (NUDIX family)
MPGEIFNSTRIAVECDGLVAMAQRAHSGEQGGMHEIFGGGIKKGETPLTAADRELDEELKKKRLQFLTLAPLVFEPYEITNGKHIGRKNRIFGFVAITDSMDLRLDPAEHLPGSEIWVPPDMIEHMPNVTKASKIAMSGLKYLF